MRKTIFTFISLLATLLVACGGSNEETYYTVGGVYSSIGPRSKLLKAPELDSIAYHIVADKAVEGAEDSVTVTVNLDFTRTADSVPQIYPGIRMFNLGAEGDINGYQQIVLLPDDDTKARLSDFDALKNMKEGEVVPVTFTTRSTRGAIDKFNHKKCKLCIQW